MRSLDLGFDPAGVVTTTSPFRGVEDQWAVVSEVLDGLRESGISAAAGLNLPMRLEEVPRFGMRPDAASDEVFFELHSVSPGYFNVMKIEVRAGRPFTMADDANSEPVALVSESFVEQYFPDASLPDEVIGRSLEPLFFSRGDGPTVIGVVASTRHEGPETVIVPDLYVPLSQFVLGPITLVAGEEDREVIPDLVQSAAPDLRWGPLLPYSFHLRRWYAPLQLQLLTIAVLAGLGLLMAAVGLYSTFAYQVSVSRRDIGIRKAVGASRGSLALRLTGHAILLVLLGAVAGFGVWYRALPYSQSVLGDLPSGGVLPSLFLAALLATVAILATIRPAWSAASVDPAKTLNAK